MICECLKSKEHGKKLSANRSFSTESQLGPPGDLGAATVGVSNVCDRQLCAVLADVGELPERDVPGLSVCPDLRETAALWHRSVCLYVF